MKEDAKKQGEKDKISAAMAKANERRKQKEEEELAAKAAEVELLQRRWKASKQAQSMKQRILLSRGFNTWRVLYDADRLRALLVSSRPPECSWYGSRASYRNPYRLH